MKTIRANELTASDIGKIATVSDEHATTISGVLTAVEFRAEYVADSTWAEPDRRDFIGVEVRVSFENQRVLLPSDASVVVES